MVRNVNTDRVPIILACWTWIKSGSDTEWRFIACNHGVQHGMHAGLVIETPYCTQQIGVLTRGMTLRAIHTVNASTSRVGCYSERRPLNP